MTFPNTTQPGHRAQLPLFPDLTPPRHTCRTGRTRRSVAAPSDKPTGPTLSADARALLEQARTTGKLTESQAKRQLGRDPGGALRELLATWQLLEVPGSAGGRTGRGAYYRPLPDQPEPTPLTLQSALHALSGRSGTLRAFMNHLQLAEGETLGILRCLIAQGDAQGGPVGATFAFRVHPVTVTPKARTVHS